MPAFLIDEEFQRLLRVILTLALPLAWAVGVEVVMHYLKQRRI